MIEHLIKALRESVTPVEIDPAKVYVRGASGDVISNEKMLDAPRRNSGTVTAHDVESFVGLWEILSQPGKSRVYVDRRNAIPSFIGVLNDWNFDGKEWRDWCVKMTPMHSPEWSVWAARNDRWMDQGDFAEFIERNLSDFVDPKGAEMLEVAHNISASANTAVEGVISEGQNIVRKTSNSAAVKAGRGSIALPRKFSIGIPVFRYSKYCKINCLLRWQICDEKLQLAYVMLNGLDAIEAQVQEMVDTIKISGAMVVNGAPS
jgi:uncharacterized protein YfdQ (DUF2303 family)